MDQQPAPPAQVFLPDLCTIRMVFTVIIIAQLFAFILVLYPGKSPLNAWQHLGLVSLFVQWCALTSSAVLCVSREFLGKFSNVVAGALSYLVILVIVYVISEVTFWMLSGSGLGQIFIRQTHFSFVTRNILIGTLIGGPVLRYFYIQHQWKQRITAESRARFDALQARIQPHFLFNSLNTIASLTQIDPDKAEAAVENLADLFRVSLQENAQHHTLKEECELCRRYIDIEVLRLGERVNINWHIDNLPGDALLPPLLLQPLLENAIYHGIERLPDGGTIDINGTLHNKQICIAITNPIADNESTEQQGHQLALENVKQRLQTFYLETLSLKNAGRTSIDLQRQDNHFNVELCFPYINKYEDPDRR